MKKYARIVILTLFCLTSAWFHRAPAVSACTLWGVTGNTVNGRGTLAAGNIDGHPSCTVRLEFTRPGNGYRYLACFLYASGVSMGARGGINEKGLAVASASAQVRSSAQKAGGKAGLNECILRNYHSVDSFLADKGILSSYACGFHLVADRKKMVMVEIAPGGAHTLQVVDRGPLYHANEYCSPHFTRFNGAQGRSSRIRYERIRNLMTTHAGFFNLDHFVSISQDQHDGPNDSLWRIGMTADSERTLATWIVHMSAAGAPVVYLRTANAGEDNKTLKRTIHHSFWRNQQAGKISM